MPNTTIQLNSAQDVKDLLADIRQAARASKRGGGLYRVWRTNDHGEKIIIEVHVPCE